MSNLKLKDMKQYLSFFLFIFVFCLVGYSVEQEFPASLSLEDGTVYEGVKLINRTPSEVVFKYSGGVKNLKIAELSEEVQELLNYSEVDALVVDEAQAEKTTLRLQQIAAAEKAQEDANILAEKKKHVFMLRGYVYRVLDDGLLIQAGEPTDLTYYGIRVSESEVAAKKYKRYSVVRPQREFGLVYLKRHPRFEDLTDSDIIDVNVYRDGIFRYDGKTLKQFVFLKDF
jgi:hypothetical protein